MQEKWDGYEFNAAMFSDEESEYCLYFSINVYFDYFIWFYYCNVKIMRSFSKYIVAKHLIMTLRLKRDVRYNLMYIE